MNGEATAIRPSKTWYAIAAALLAIGVVAMPAWLVTRIVRAFSAGEQFVVPTTKTFALPETGKYVLWHDTKISTPSRESHSVCTFTIDAAGEYAVSVTGLDSARVLTLRRSVLDAMGWDIAQCIVFFLVCGIGGTTMIVVVALRRSKATKASRAGAPGG